MSTPARELILVFGLFAKTQALRRLEATLRKEAAGRAAAAAELKLVMLELTHLDAGTQRQHFPASLVPRKCFFHGVSTNVE